MSNRVSRTIPDEWLNAIAHIESRGNPLAANPTSTAVGLYQFIKSTWRGTVKQHRPDVFKAYPNGALLNLRKNASFAIEMGARFTEDNQRVIGTGASLGSLYLAHFFGAGTARKVFKAAADA